MLERVERDLSRYAAGYEAGRIESMSKEQTQKMEDTVRLMKELQRDLNGQPVQGIEPRDSNTEIGADEEPSSEEDTDSEWEANEMIGEKILFISSAANIRRKEIQSRMCPKQVANHKKGKKKVLDLKETKNLINETMEKDLRGVKTRNKNKRIH